MKNEKRDNLKVAIVLFNLGGPLTSKDVRPFLFNLFSDKQIIRLPFFLRLPLAWWIAKTRTPFAQANYNLMKGCDGGVNAPSGGSPLLPNTQAQAKALETEIRKTIPHAKTFIAMRYWHPRASETLQQVKTFAPDKIVLLPLYPHYSTTTTEPSLGEWKSLAKKYDAITHPVCCWWNEPAFIRAQCDLLTTAQASNPDQNFKVLFSAHGIPESLIKKGDPYQRHIENSAAQIAQAANLKPHQWSLAYQSRVGWLKWLEPETGSEIQRLAKMHTTLFIIPLSFVSEHIETLVELDIEFRNLATQAGLKNYIRVPTLNCHPTFISLLAALITRSLSSNSLLCPDETPCTTTY